ncbi:hypothetical protein [Roseiconus lacunae]|uniref:Uncharacterized protein n=3 Tax=Roseiconus lacunae TaxID=2605694 RepID=A0ABT7PQV8_9BACT|nr:hypothetical protein [Roseiconus lacunae]MDM4018894.1 hypothetical protein [Roseiconus lacunae]
MIDAFERLTFPLRWIATFIAMAVLYYLLVTPLAIWFRWSGRSIRRRGVDAETFWRQTSSVERGELNDGESYFRMF